MVYVPCGWLNRSRRKTIRDKEYLVSHRYRTSAQAPTTHRRKVVTGMTVGLLSVSAVSAVAVSVKAGSGSEGTQVKTVSSVSQGAGSGSSAGQAGNVDVAGMV